MDIFDITASALTAQRMRMDVISSNLANVNTTRQEDGSVGAYKRKNVTFAPVYNQAMQTFQSPFNQGNSGASSIGMKPASHGLSIGPDGKPMLKVGVHHSAFQGAGVHVTQITDDTQNPTKLVYDPSHPDSNEEGYVEMPNVNVVTEMVDMISASRAYEANVTAMSNAKNMARAAMDM